MGSLGQVEGVQMESRQETPAALAVEENEKGLGEGREKRVTEGRAYCIYFSLGGKARSYVNKSSRGKKGQSLSNESQGQLGFNLGIQLSWRIQLFSKKMAGLKEKKTL